MGLQRKIGAGKKPRCGSRRREREPHGFGGEKREDHAALAEWGPHGSTQVMVPGA